MYKVKILFPQNHLREIIMERRELSSWLACRYLRERIVSYEKVS